MTGLRDKRGMATSGEGIILISELLTLMLLLIALVHLKPFWRLELKRRRGSSGGVTLHQ